MLNLIRLNENCLRIVYEMKLLGVLKDKSKNGIYNIKIRVTNNRQVGYIKTDFYAFKEDFDSSSGLLKEVRIKKGQETPELESKKIAHDFQNSKIRELLASYNKKYAQLVDKEGRDINWFISYFKDDTWDDLNLVNYYEAYIKKLSKQGRISYAESHNSTLNRLKKFTVLDTIPFKNINYNFLENFENWLREDGCSISTIAIYMRNIRVLYNDAIKRDKIDFGLYPFRKFEVSKRLKPIVKKRNLSIEIIKFIKERELTDSLEILARDIFLLSFYLIGANLKDIYNLEYIKNGRIHYNRAKTKREYNIKLFPQTQELIEKYRGNKKLLIFQELYSNHRNLNKIVNKKLQSIAKELKINENITTYYARHSWATIASKLDISKDVIQHALGHGNRTVTDLYIDFDLAKVDDANEKVINSIN